MGVSCSVVGDLEEIDLALAKMDAVIARRGPPKHRTAAYVALHQKQGVEVSGKGYARQPLEGRNTTFAVTGAWGPIEFVAIYDNEGVLLAELPLTPTGRNVTAGDTLQVAVEFGQLHIYDRHGMCVECGRGGPNAKRGGPKGVVPWERI